MISWFTNTVLSLITSFGLGPAFFQADVRETVSFKNDGSGQARLEIKLKDARPELLTVYACPPGALHRILDSVGRNLNMPPQLKGGGTMHEWTAGYDSLQNLLSIRFSFESPAQLNQALSYFAPDNSGNIYSMDDNTISRGPAPLFLGAAWPLPENTPATRKGFYHAYKLRIELPDGIKKVKIENRNPSAFIENRGQAITVETDMKELSRSQILAATIRFKTF